jgi:hypothetical protein
MSSNVSVKKAIKVGDHYIQVTTSTGSQVDAITKQKTTRGQKLLKIQATSRKSIFFDPANLKEALDAVSSADIAEDPEKPFIVKDKSGNVVDIFAVEDIIPSRYKDKEKFTIRKQLLKNVRS